MRIEWKNNKLLFEGKLIKPNIRKARDMWEVLYDKNAMKGRKDDELYYMHRGICYPEHKAIIERYKLRYDITVIPPIMLGKEYNKTAGHFHAEVKPSLTFTEIYEVIEGEPTYIMQSSDDVYFVKAKPKEHVIIPPNYGHITINAGKKTLIIANWNEKDFKSDYKPIISKNGGMYFLTVDGWIGNENYNPLPELREEKAFRFTSKPMYYAFLDEPEEFLFLTKPDMFSFF